MSLDPSPPRSPPDPLNGWPPQAFSFGLFFFAYYGYVGVFSPYASLYFSHRGMNAAEIGVLLSLTQVMRIFGPYLWGSVADHTQRRVAVLRVTALAAVSTFFCVMPVQGFAAIFAVMIAFNFFTSAQGPLSEAFMLSEMRGDLTHYGRLRVWGSVGFMVSVLVAGRVLDWQGDQFMPWIAGALLLLVFFSTLRMEESRPVQKSGATPSVLALLRKREVVAFFASTFLMIAAHAALYVFYSLYLAQHGYSKTFIGLMWALGVLVEIGFFFYQAPIFRRFTVRSVMLVCLLLAVVRFLLIGYFADSLFLLLLAQALHAATFGGHHSASVMTLQRWFSGPLQARGQALYISISYGLGGSLGGMALSLLWERFGGQTVYCTAALLCGAAALAASASYRWQSQ